MELMEKLVKRFDLQVGSFCARQISLTDPVNRKESLEMAKRLSCRNLIAVTGNTLEGAAREAQYQCVVDGLKACLPLLERSGVTLVLEPLSVKVNNPGYFLETSAEAFKIIDEVGSPHIQVLYDVYHQQITEGDLSRTFTANKDKIGYFHVADHPGRHEPGTGEIAYPFLISKLREMGYAGFVGLEFHPTGMPEAGLQTCLEILT
jgi:hydroxypyruvate isomerase